MKNLLNPKWLLFINSLPVIILFILLKNNYDTILSLLDESSIKTAHYIGTFLLLIGIVNLIYALFSIFKKKKVSLYCGIFSLIINILFLYIFTQYSRDIFLFSIPQWMISEYIQLYPWTFLMPSLFYSLLVIVLRLTPENKTYSVWQSFLYALLIPVFWFLIIQVIIPLRLNLPYNFSEHLTIVFIIVTILLFFFLLIRGIYILTLRKNELWKKYELLWKIPVALILPLLGLYINNSEFKHWNWTLFNQKGGIFGDFNSLWFYILAIINGSLICIPDAKKTNTRLLLFLGKSITFAYTLYFFLVFIPFLPLSIFAIVILGLGFFYSLLLFYLFSIFMNYLKISYFYNNIIQKIFFE